MTSSSPIPNELYKALRDMPPGESLGIGTNRRGNTVIINYGTGEKFTLAKGVHRGKPKVRKVYV